MKMYGDDGKWLVSPCWGGRQGKASRLGTENCKVFKQKQMLG
jgi:hypothetical protein